MMKCFDCTLISRAIDMWTRQPTPWHLTDSVVDWLADRQPRCLDLVIATTSTKVVIQEMYCRTFDYLTIQLVVRLICRRRQAKELPRTSSIYSDQVADLPFYTESGKIPHYNTSSYRDQFRFQSPPPRLENMDREVIRLAHGHTSIGGCGVGQ